MPLTSTMRPGVGCTLVRSDEPLWSGGIGSWGFCSSNPLPHHLGTSEEQPSPA